MTNCAISAKNYEHVLNVWTFRMKVMNCYDCDYHDLSLKVVLLLVFVLETFRKESINSFEFDPAHYLFTPRYTWYVIKRFTCLHVIILSRIPFRVNQYSIVAESQGTSCLKQTQYLKFKWQPRDLTIQPISL